MEKPNILIVNFILPGDNNATGHTMKNMFCGMPANFLQFCLDYSQERHKTVYQTLFLDKKRNAIYVALKEIYRRRSNRVSDQNAKSVMIVKPSLKTEFIKTIVDYFPRFLDKATLKKIDNFKPDIIYSMGNDIVSTRLALKFARRYNCPILLHIMDDIESTLYSYYDQTKFFRKVYLGLLKQAYQLCPHALAIGPKMAQEFSKRHSTPFNYAMNCVESVYNSPRLIREDELLIIFSGGLHGGRIDTLKLLAQEIERTNKHNTKKLKLEIYTKKTLELEVFKNLKYTSVFDYVEQDKMFDNLSRADVLLHVESFDKHYIEYFKYSMSTKIPEYLAVGRPVLVIGSNEIATVEYIQQIAAGWVVADSLQISEVLNKIVNSSEAELEAYANNALEAVRKNHLQTAVQTQVWDTINSSITAFKQGGT